MGWKIQQMDVKTTFLNRVIQEEVHIEQPEGFETFDQESHVWRIKWYLYGLALEVWQGDGELFVSQGKYADNMLQRFCMESCKTMETPLVTN